jgi:hypothetical protein
MGARAAVRLCGVWFPVRFRTVGLDGDTHRRLRAYEWLPKHLGFAITDHSY